MHDIIHTLVAVYCIRLITDVVAVKTEQTESRLNTTLSIKWLNC